MCGKRGVSRRLAGFIATFLKFRLGAYDCFVESTIMKKVLLIIVVVFAVLAGVMVFRAMTFSSVQLVAREVDLVDVDVRAAAKNLAEAVKIESISFWAPTSDGMKAFRAFHGFLENTYPKVHAALEREKVRDFSLLYTWPGSDSSLKPLCILGHMDVVPAVNSGTEEWEFGPFEGAIADGFVWGRGTMDDKVNVVCAMEAVELLLSEGFQPRRTVMMAFGHDEELGGPEGAQVMAALLEERGIELECVIDEGGFIIDGALPGVTEPSALIGVAEKGYVTLELLVKRKGGHSSVPPRNSAIGILSAALARLEHKQMPARLSGAAEDMFMAVGPEMGFAARLAFANLWLTRPVVEFALGQEQATNPLIRTTTAVTMIEGGVKDNVLPTEAKAVVNFRILPGDSIDSVLHHAKNVVGDKRVIVRQSPNKDGREPSMVSDVNAPAYRLLEQTAKDVFPEVVVGPYLVFGGTDSRYYSGVTPNVYRFTPMRVTSEDTARLHGVNERIGLENVGEIVQFYARLIQNFDAA